MTEVHAEQHWCNELLRYFFPRPRSEYINSVNSTLNNIPGQFKATSSRSKNATAAELAQQQPLCIDGSLLEGGGQTLRNSTALAAITGRSIQVDKIRAGWWHHNIPDFSLAWCSCRNRPVPPCYTQDARTPGSLHSI